MQAVDGRIQIRRVRHCYMHLLPKPVPYDVHDTQACVQQHFNFFGDSLGYPSQFGFQVSIPCPH